MIFFLKKWSFFVEEELFRRKYNKPEEKKIDVLTGNNGFKSDAKSTSSAARGGGINKKKNFVAMFLAGLFTTKMSGGSRKHRVAMVKVVVLDEVVIIAVVFVALLVVSTADLDKEIDIEMVITPKAVVKVALCRFKTMHRHIHYQKPTKISVQKSVNKATSFNKGKVIRNHRQTMY